MGLVQFPHCSAAIFRRSFMGWAQTYGQGSIPSLPSTASSPLPCATQHWLQQEQGWRKAPVSKRGWELPAEFARTVMEQEQAMMQTAELIFFFLIWAHFQTASKKIFPAHFITNQPSLLQNDSLCHRGRRYELPHVSEKAYEVISFSHHMKSIISSHNEKARM